MRFPLTVSLLLLLAAPVVAHAAPGDASSIIAACGAPDSDTYGKGEATGLPQRTVVYGKARLEFASTTDSPSDARWEFTNAWFGHLPETAAEIAKRMPCVGQGLAAAQQGTGNQLASDPSIAFQSQPEPVKRSPFGIAYLWMILFLFGVIAIFAVAIPRRRVMRNGPQLADRPFRRPQVQIARFRRKPKVTSVPTNH